MEVYIFITFFLRVLQQPQWPQNETKEKGTQAEEWESKKERDGARWGGRERGRSVHKRFLCVCVCVCEDMRLCGTTTHTCTHTHTLRHTRWHHPQPLVWGQDNGARSKELGAGRKEHGERGLISCGRGSLLVGVNIVICCDIEVIVCPFDAVQIPSATHTHTHKRTHLFICTHIYVHIYTEVLKGHLNVCLQLGRSTGRGANTDRRHLGAHYHFRLIGEWAKCHASVSHGTKKTINYLRHLAHLAAIASQRPTVMERK